MRQPQGGRVGQPQIRARFVPAGRPARPRMGAGRRHGRMHASCRMYVCVCADRAPAWAWAWARACRRPCYLYGYDAARQRFQSTQSTRRTHLWGRAGRRTGAATRTPAPAAAGCGRLPGRSRGSGTAACACRCSVFECKSSRPWLRRWFRCPVRGAVTPGYKRPKVPQLKGPPRPWIQRSSGSNAITAVEAGALHLPADAAARAWELARLMMGMDRWDLPV